LIRLKSGEIFAIYGSTNLDDPGERHKHHFVASVRVETPDGNSCPGSDLANWIHFFDPNTGEKPMGPMVLFDKVLYLTTYTPGPMDGCTPGEGKLIAVDAMKKGTHLDDWDQVNALQDDQGNAVSELTIPDTIPSGVLMINLPRCVQGVDGKYYSTNLPDAGFDGFGNMGSGLDNPQLVVPLGSAGPNNQMGPSSEDKKQQTKFMPAKVIKGGAGGGVRSRVIPTSWSLIFD
jgi:hypothetical protein